MRIVLRIRLEFVNAKMFYMDASFFFPSPICWKESGAMIPVSRLYRTSISQSILLHTNSYIDLLASTPIDSAFKKAYSVFLYPSLLSFVNTVCIRTADIKSDLATGDEGLVGHIYICIP